MYKQELVLTGPTQGLLDSIKQAGDNAFAEYNIRKFDKETHLKILPEVVKEDDEVTRLKQLSGIRKEVTENPEETLRVTDIDKELNNAWRRSKEGDSRYEYR